MKATGAEMVAVKCLLNGSTPAKTKIVQDIVWSIELYTRARALQDYQFIVVLRALTLPEIMKNSGMYFAWFTGEYV
jgi:hypothetical protein